MIRSTPIARREVVVEAIAGATVEAVHAVDNDEALPLLRVAGVAAEARAEHDPLQRLQQLLASLVWLLTRQPNGETVRRPKKKPKDDVSLPLAHTAISILRHQQGRKIRHTLLAPIAPTTVPHHPPPTPMTPSSSHRRITSLHPRVFQSTTMLMRPIHHIIRQTTPLDLKVLTSPTIPTVT